MFNLHFRVLASLAPHKSVLCLLLVVAMPLRFSGKHRASPKSRYMSPTLSCWSGVVICTVNSTASHEQEAPIWIGLSLVVLSLGLHSGTPQRRFVVSNAIDIASVKYSAQHAALPFIIQKYKHRGMCVFGCMGWRRSSTSSRVSAAWMTSWHGPDHNELGVPGHCSAL